MWRAECERSRRIVDGSRGLDETGVAERKGGYALRWLMLWMIAGYAGHAGHAGLLREGIDGAVGLADAGSGGAGGAPAAEPG